MKPLTLQFPSLPYNLVPRWPINIHKFSSSAPIFWTHSFYILRDQVVHPYTTTGKTTVLYSWIFIFSESEEQDKRLGPAVCPTYTAAQQLWPVTLTSKACLTVGIVIEVPFVYKSVTNSQTVCSHWQHNSIYCNWSLNGKWRKLSSGV
jgi:hypothetical protein